MNHFDDFRRYLPQYLSPESQDKLYEGLKQFPTHVNSLMFSERMMSEKEVFQGDGLKSMPVVNLPDSQIVYGPVLVLSNTCDISTGNMRVTTPSITYCPIIKLSKLCHEYESAGMPESSSQDLLTSIRKQRKSHFFFLPKFGGLPEDCVALLDHALSAPITVLSENNIVEHRLFSLSNLGFYLFLVKLGIHFTRVMEGIDRG